VRSNSSTDKPARESAAASEEPATTLSVNIGFTTAAAAALSETGRNRAGPAWASFHPGFTGAVTTAGELAAVAATESPFDGALSLLQPASAAMRKQAKKNFVLRGDMGDNL
jgi:hypothetical protein